MMELFFSSISPMSIFWLAALILFSIAEAATVGLVSIWFAAGALVALLLAGIGAKIWIQVAAFLIVSAVLLALLRPMMGKMVKPKQTRTNADRHIGREALVVEDIDNLLEKGAVRIDGVVWSARAENDVKITAGTRIRIQKIQGAKLIVVPAQQPANV